MQIDDCWRTVRCSRLLTVTFEVDIIFKGSNVEMKGEQGLPLYIWAMEKTSSSRYCFEIVELLNEKIRNN